MTFETPIQPVPARPPRTAIVFAALLVAAAGLLVWQPWSPRSGVRLATAMETSSPPSGWASPRSSSPDRPPPSRGPIVASGLPTGRPPIVSGPFPTPPPGFAVAVPAADRFDARWSSVGVAELAEGAYRITQLPLFPTAGFAEGRSAGEICLLGRERFPYVGILPADRLRFLGVVTPTTLRGAWVDLGWIGTAERPAYEVLLGATSGGSASPVHLFALADRGLWPAGAYRFLVFTAYGAPHYLYACLH